MMEPRLDSERLLPQITSGGGLGASYGFSKQDYLVVTCLASATFTSCFLGGMIIIAIPQIALDLGLSTGQRLWPITLFSLATACTLLICGSLSDRLGSRLVFNFGCFLQVLACTACGLSRDGTQLFAARIVSGIAVSCCQPSAISLVTQQFRQGPARNLVMASIGGGQPVGFAVGLTVGAVMSEKFGWRFPFFVLAGLGVIISVLSYATLPDEEEFQYTTFKSRMQKALVGIDWIGALIISLAIGLLIVELSAMTDSLSRIKDLDVTIGLTLSIMLAGLFILWEHLRKTHNKPILIDLALWKEPRFTCICANVFLIWGSFNAFDQLVNFILQDIEHLSHSQVAIRFLPSPTSALLCNVIIGLTLHKVTALSMVVSTTFVSSISFVIMGLYQPEWPYWASLFPALILSTMSSDALFSVANTMIEDIFDRGNWALAAGIFNTVSQLGKAVGLATTAMVSSSVSENLQRGGMDAEKALMRGYNSGFVFLLLTNIISLGISFLCFSRREPAPFR